MGYLTQFIWLWLSKKILVSYVEVSPELMLENIVLQ